MRRREVVRPVRRDPDLRGPERHGAQTHLSGQIVLDLILLLEVALVESDARWSTFWPDVVECVGPAKLERNDVVEFAGLVGAPRESLQE